MVDVQTCTGADVAMAIIPDSVRKPVAEAIPTFMLALAYKLSFKVCLIREAKWGLKARAYVLGLNCKTVGSIGLRNIANYMFRLLKSFDIERLLTYDPYVSPDHANLGV